ncbi:hypothetical protein V2J09_003674 [Rumex salicifolius]
MISVTKLYTAFYKDRWESQKYSNKQVENQDCNTSRESQKDYSQQNNNQRKLCSESNEVIKRLLKRELRPLHIDIVPSTPVLVTT